MYELLWKEIRAGESTAMKRLYQESYQLLFIYAFRLTADRDLAKDSVHELFCDIWERRHTLSDVENVPAYLRTSLKNKILRDIKRIEATDSITDSTLHHDLVEHSYEELLIRTQTGELQQQRLQQALARLTPMQAEVIKLKYFEKKSYAEIAALLNLQERTVYNHAFMAITTLRNEIHKKPIIKK